MIFFNFIKNYYLQLITLSSASHTLLLIDYNFIPKDKRNFRTRTWEEFSMGTHDVPFRITSAVQLPKYCYPMHSSALRKPVIN